MCCSPSRSTDAPEAIRPDYTGDLTTQGYLKSWPLGPEHYSARVGTKSSLDIRIWCPLLTVCSLYSHWLKRPSPILNSVLYNPENPHFVWYCPFLILTFDNYCSNVTNQCNTSSYATIWQLLSGKLSCTTDRRKAINKFIDRIFFWISRHIKELICTSFLEDSTKILPSAKTINTSYIQNLIDSLGQSFM